MKLDRTETTERVTPTYSLTWGALVTSGAGHYGTAYAVQEARALGWEPVDAQEVDALVLTYIATGWLGVTTTDANVARVAAGMAPLTEDDYAGGLHDVFEWLVSANDDATDWLNDHAELPCACAYVGWWEGEYGVWSLRNDFGSDDGCDAGDDCTAEVW